MSRELLNQQLKLLQKQFYWLKRSYEKCLEIDTNAEVMNPEDYDQIENLCSRYARSIDFLIRKMFRTIDDYEFENQGTLIDVVNNALKRGLLDDIEMFRQMKELRNDIVHEYINDELSLIFSDVLEYTFKLIAIMTNTINYVDNILNEK